MASHFGPAVCRLVDGTRSPLDIIMGAARRWASDVLFAPAGRLGLPVLLTVPTQVAQVRSRCGAAASTERRACSRQVARANRLLARVSKKQGRNNLDRFLRYPLVAIALVFLVIAMLVAIHKRIEVNYHMPHGTEQGRFGYVDFHNGIYWPAHALASRISPYGAEYLTAYPVERSVPFYWPTTFWIHMPLALLPLPSAELVYFLLMIAMVCGLGLIALQAADIPYSVGWLALIVVAILASRSGYGTMFSGYFTFELALATLLALRCGDRPWLGGTLFAIAASKPTYGIPLAVMMIARGHGRAVAVGAGLSLATGLLFYLWLLPGRSWDFWLADIRFGQAQHMADPNEIPELSWTRVDATGLVAKWLRWDPGELWQLAIFLLACVWPMRLIWRLRQDPEAISLGSRSTLVSLLSMSVLLYRHYYDLVLLIVPVTVLLFGRAGWLAQESWRVRGGLAALMLVAMYNYGSTLSFFEHYSVDRPGLIFQVLTSLSGLATLAALVWAMRLGANDGQHLGEPPLAQASRGGPDA